MEELKAKLHHNKQAAAASGQVPGRARNERHESSPHAHETIGGVRALSADDPLGHRVESERVTARTARSCRSRRDVEVSVRTERDAERVVLDRRAPEDVLPTGTQIDPNDVARSGSGRTPSRSPRRRRCCPSQRPRPARSARGTDRHTHRRRDSPERAGRTPPPLGSGSAHRRLGGCARLGCGAGLSRLSRRM